MTRPLNPDAFPEPMRPIVRWHLLFDRADRIAAEHGLGLASVWSLIKRGRYHAAETLLDQIEGRHA